MASFPYRPVPGFAVSASLRKDRPESWVNTYLSSNTLLNWIALYQQKCELCPSKDGALKKTDNNNWAHVVCALYIPEVRFGNNNTMEPIVLQLVPPERYSRTCSLCEEQGKEAKSKVGACMQCNKQGCKHYFHVTWYDTIDTQTPYLPQN